jgi:putative ABC transport system permease protein
MIGHYIRLFFRQFLRQKTYQIISVCGLALGIGAVIVIAAWIHFETTFDSFHANSGRIARIYEIQEYPNGNLDVAVTPFPLGPALAQNFSEVEADVRLWYGPGFVLSRDDKRFFESGPIYADSNFFEVFSYELAAGNPATVLDQKNTAVISQDLAEKYFQDQNPVGQTLRIDGSSDLLITGVMKPFPKNSHLSASIVISMTTVSNDWPAQRRENWGLNGYSTYVLMREGTDHSGFAARLEHALTQFRGTESTTRLYSQPIADIHLGRELVADNTNVADPSRLWVFASAAFLVLLLACINYVNLATARAGLRLREFGVRSCLGAGIGQIRRQVIAEALAASAVATLLALVLTELTFPLLRDILSPDLPREALRNGFTLALLPVIWAITGLSAGVYPALMFAQTVPARMLRDHRSHGSHLRRVLVVVQFAVSVILIVMTMVILRQQRFMRSTAIAVDAEKLLVIPLRGDEAQQHYATYRDEMRRINGVSDVSAVAQLPSQIVWSSTFNWEGQAPGEEVLFNTDQVDDQFVSTFRLKLAEGRNFGSGETDVCLLNETAMKQIGWTSAVGKMMYLDDSLPATIVGVLKDFHFSSMRDEIAPLVLRPESAGYTNLILRISTDDIETTMKRIEETSERLLPNTPYRSFFFDQAFDRLYGAEIRMQQTLNIFATLAIVLACLGLFGLATFSIERRTKEVGVRKVLGASVNNIIRLHLREYVGWLIAANALALPLAYFLGQKWLAGFAYRTDMPWWMFLIAAATTLSLALLTVIIQTVRAAAANPVKSLRYE